MIDHLKKEGLSVTLMSGDSRRTSEAIAAAVGCSSVAAEATPVRKREMIAEMQSDQGRKVMMIGDGINDAPALTQSSVGLAMGRGTDIAMESADAVLMRDDLRLIPYMLGLSRRALSIIRQNIFWAFFYNLIAVPLAVAGLLHPVMAAAAMAASSLFVVGNSFRIRGAAEERQ